MTDRQQQSEHVKLQEFRALQVDQRLEELYRQMRAGRRRSNRLSASMMTMTTQLAVMTTQLANLMNRQDENKADWKQALGWIVAAALAAFTVLTKK